MKVSSLVFTFGVLTQGILAQQEFLAKLPNCAVGFRYTSHTFDTNDLQSKCVLATVPSSKCSPSDFECLCADTEFMNTAAACNANNCTVVEVLQATNETFAACGIPIRDQSATLLGVTASIGGLALLMVILRLADRGISAQAQLGWDDLLIGLSGVCSEFHFSVQFLVSCVGILSDISSSSCPSA